MIKVAWQRKSDTIATPRRWGYHRKQSISLHTLTRRYLYRFIDISVARYLPRCRDVPITTKLRSVRCLNASLGIIACRHQKCYHHARWVVCVNRSVGPYVQVASERAFTALSTSLMAMRSHSARFSSLDTPLSPAIS